MQDKKVVLVVDDVDLNVQILSNILDEDYIVKKATNGVVAIEEAMQKPIPDLILLDVKMPYMGGYEVLEELKKTSVTKNIPVIFITSSDTIEDEEKGLAMGAVDYITKPVRSLIVKARVKTHITLKVQRDKLIYAALHDQLTGLYNRHHFSVEGKRIFSRSKRRNDKFSVIMMDIDYFKSINDNYGHLKGDEILRTVAKLLMKNRAEDLSARYGGEEFIIILEDCLCGYAQTKAEKLRQEIEHFDFNGINVTASFGVAELKDSHMDFEELLKDADTALYKAKESGRNKVCTFYG